MKPYCIRRPLITEKTLMLANLSNTYTFLVDRTATKKQVKAAVEAVFGTQVLRVRTVLNAAIRKRTGRKRVLTQFAKEKKALVTLKAGQTIDLFDVSNQA